MAKSWMLDRQEVLETMRKCNSLHEAYMSLAKLPAADVRENVKGEWKIDGLCSCSVCGHTAPYDALGDVIEYWPNLNFCPNCGAQMGGAEDG